MTVTAKPAEYSSVHDDLVYTVTDAHTADPVTYPNYKFIADVYINSIQVASLKKVPRPDNSVGVFNIGQIVRSRMDASLNPDFSAGLSVQELTTPDFGLDVNVKFGEEYAFTEYTNLAESSGQMFYNSYNKNKLKIVKNELSGYTDKIMTNMTGSRDVMLNTAYYFLSYFSISNSPVTITLNTSNGGSLDLSFTPADSDHRVYVLCVSPVMLNSLSADIINGSTQWYTITVNGQVFRFNIFCEAIHDIYPIHFMNQYGGFETKLFTKLSRKTYTGEKKDFGVLDYVIGDDGSVTQYNDNLVVNESIRNYSSQFSPKLSLNSDILTDEEYRWLIELVYATLVYTELDSGDDLPFLVPCKITDTNHEDKKYINDNLTNLVINIDYGKTLNTQYR